MKDETVAFGIAKYPMKHEVGSWTSFDENTIVYRPYNGKLYPSGKEIEKSHQNDTVRFVYSPIKPILSIFKVI